MEKRLPLWRWDMVPWFGSNWWFSWVQVTKPAAAPGPLVHFGNASTMQGWCGQLWCFANRISYWHSKNNLETFFFSAGDWPLLYIPSPLFLFFCFEIASLCSPDWPLLPNYRDFRHHEPTHLVGNTYFRLNKFECVACMYVCALHACLVPEVGRGCNRSLWVINWSFLGGV